MSHKIPLPIELYYSVKFHVFNVIFSGMLFWLGHTVNNIAPADDWLIIIVGVVLMFIATISILISMIAIINPTPALIITRYHIANKSVIFNKQSQLAFKQIHSLELDYRVIKDMKHWHIAITLNTGQKRFIPIRSMKYETVMINEKEIFHLIEQVYQGKTPPSFEHFEMDIHDRMTGWGIFVMVFMVSMFVIAKLMQ